MNVYDHPQVTNMIQYALAEDLGSGDITALAIIPEDKHVKGRLIVKEDAIVCGLALCARVFRAADRGAVFTSRAEDGAGVKKGTVIAEVEGNARGLLCAERTALNLLQRLSGIASGTARAVRAVSGTNVKIADTRKTTPGLRILEKHAVRMGGGFNHRYNLSDGILIKDNHIAAAGGIINAVRAARRNAPHTLKIEVEVENFDQLNQAILAGADIIMLDNMTEREMARAVEITAGRALLEASGNMGDRDLEAIARTGVDFISIGALTHTVRAADISLMFDPD